jgi:hypothetical protein
MTTKRALTDMRRREAEYSPKLEWARIMCNFTTQEPSVLVAVSR